MSDSSNRSLGKSLIRNVVGVMGSRVTGLLRDIVVSSFWGATGIFQAAYSTSFGLTNSLRSLFGEGAFSSAFVPLISQELVKDDNRQSAWTLANRAITLQIIVLGLITLIGGGGAFCCSRWSLFEDNLVQHYAMAIMPLVLPFAFLICLSGALSGVLNSLHIFLIPSAVQMIFNICQVATVLYLGFFWTNEDFTALIVFCLSTSLSGLLELLVLLIQCRRKGYAFKFDRHVFAPEVLLLCRKMVPGMIGAGLHQLNYFIDISIATVLGSVAIGALWYSQRLVYLPIGLFGAAMSMVCLPVLAQARARNDQLALNDAFNYSMRIVLFMSLPATAFLAICGPQLIALFFQRGAFTVQATSECSWALLFYVIGLPAFCIGKIATNPFHARLDTRTPMLVNLGCLILNLILNLLLMRPMRQGGLALSTSICSWVSVIILFALNRPKMPGWSPRRPLIAAAEYAVASVLSGGAAYSVLLFVGPLMGNFIWAKICLVVSCLAGAAAVYLAACLLMRRSETVEFFKTILMRGRRKQKKE